METLLFPVLKHSPFKFRRCCSGTRCSQPCARGAEFGVKQGRSRSYSGLEQPPDHFSGAAPPLEMLSADDPVFQYTHAFVNRCWL